MRQHIIRFAVMAGMAAGALSFTPTAGVAALPHCDYNTWARIIGTEQAAQIPIHNGLIIDCVMGQGSQSSAVWTLQLTLNNCYGAGLALDSIFGSRTKAALVRAQQSAGTTADGVYGPKTRKAIVWWPGSLPCGHIQ